MSEGLSQQSQIEPELEQGLVNPVVSQNVLTESDEKTQRLSEIRRRILVEPHTTKRQVEKFMEVDNVEELVENGRLLAFRSDEDDELQFPLFQFDPLSHSPYDVIGVVNRILDAPSNGRGVTAWWILPNSRLPLDKSPREYLRVQAAHEVLIKLAEFVKPKA